MDKKYLYCLITLFAPCAHTYADETTDSVATHNLKEIVVEGERAWIEGNKAIFIPSKSEKNLAHDPFTLIQRMNLPTVIIDPEGGIKSLSGKNKALNYRNRPRY